MAWHRPEKSIMLLKISQSNVIVVFPHFAYIVVLTKCPHDYLTKDFDPFLELFFYYLVR